MTGAGGIWRFFYQIRRKSVIWKEVSNFVGGEKNSRFSLAFPEKNPRNFYATRKEEEEEERG